MYYVREIVDEILHLYTRPIKKEEKKLNSHWNILDIDINYNDQAEHIQDNN